MNEAQMAKVKELSSHIYGVMKEAVKDMWRKEDEEFLKGLSEDVAREKTLASISDNPDQHLKNIEHLAVTLQGEVVRKGLKIRVFRQDTFVKTLMTIIKIVAVPVLKAAIDKK